MGQSSLFFFYKYNYKGRAVLRAGRYISRFILGSDDIPVA
jgi:hypothetical protein